MPTPSEWSVAYAIQSRADLDAWELLRGQKLPNCELLHCLQMACEKLSKSYLCASGTLPANLQSSHAYTAKQLPLIVRHVLDIENARPGLARDLLQFTKRAAREIELLSPSVEDDGRRPDNCEYPWEDTSGRLRLPVNYSFPIEQLLQERHGRTLLKLIRTAITRLTG